MATAGAELLGTGGQRPVPEVLRAFDFCAALGATPRSGWAVDPFGYSSTMPYLLRRANLTSMLIQRVHYAIKKHFAATHSLEFMWRQMWGKVVGIIFVVCFLRHVFFCLFICFSV